MRLGMQQELECDASEDDQQASHEDEGIVIGEEQQAPGEEWVEGSLLNLLTMSRVQRKNAWPLSISNY